MAVTTIAQKALRRLGVRIVPLDDSPFLNEFVGVADIADAALIELRVMNGLPTGSEPAAVVVPRATLATQALVELGVIAADETPSTADQALAADRVASVHDGLVARGLALWTVDTIPQAVAEEYIKLVGAMIATSFGKATDPAAVALLEDRIRIVSLVARADIEFMLGKLHMIYAQLDAQGIVWWSASSWPLAFSEEATKLTVAAAAASFGAPADPQRVALLEQRIRRGAMTLSAEDNANSAVQAIHDDFVSRNIARWSVFDIPDVVGEQYAILAAQRLAPLFEQQANPQEARQAEVSIFRYVALRTSGEQMVGQYF